MKMGTVYCWVNLINGKRRVGHTMEMEKRIKTHINVIENKKTHPFYNALRKYPIEEGNWVIESIEVNKEEMLWLEKMWKIIYKTTDPEYGYDLILDESDHSGRNNPMYGRHRYGKENPMWGKKHSENAKKLQSEKAIGRKNPYLSKRNKELVGEKHPSYGKKRPDTSERNRKYWAEKKMK
jgi:group I intron endonuclease